MNIAYIIDGSTEVNSSIINNEDVYFMPFLVYDYNEELVKEFDNKKINKLQNERTDDSKLFIEPTPGMYRDMFKSLNEDGYEYIICIPQNRDDSISYINAEYAKRTSKINTIIVDVKELKLQPEQVLEELIKSKEIKKESYIMTIDYEAFIVLIKSILGRFKLAIA